MNLQQQQAIIDNPNLMCSKLASLLGLSKDAIRRFRIKNELLTNWKHEGKGIPFVREIVTCNGVYHKVCFGDRTLFAGRMKGVMLNLDRLIFCLENNEGKLPRTLHKCTFDGLEFIR